MIVKCVSSVRTAINIEINILQIEHPLLHPNNVKVGVLFIKYNMDTKKL